MRIVLVLAAASIGLAACGVATTATSTGAQPASTPDPNEITVPAATPYAASTPVPTLVPTPVPTPVRTPAPTPSGPTLTAQQQRAAQAGRDYLKLQGFSRQGLIDQLSSSFGDGYSVEDATLAVDSLNADWNAQALRAAKSYLAMQPFSCNALINQLDSSYGEKFTVDQATYGAQQAGAC